MADERDLSVLPGNEEVGGGTGILDAGDEELIKDLKAGISDYIHVKAVDHVEKSIAEAGSEALADTIAAMSYQILSMVSDKVAKASPEMVTMDLLLPLATQTIDYLIDIAEAMGIKFDAMEVREDALFRMIEIHMAKVDDDPDQRAIAEEMFAEFLEDGTFDESVQYIERRMKERGQDPSGIRPPAGPQPDRLAAGVRQGLIDQAGGG